MATLNRKLLLLQQTHDLEDEEEKRKKRKIAERNEKYEIMKSKNDNVSLMTTNELEHRKDEEIRRNLFARLIDCPTVLTPITDVLANNEGNFFFREKIMCLLLTLKISPTPKAKKPSC